jgi:DNA-binding transcriptional MerR regulator
VVEENRCYSIGELSRRSGLSVRTIRFYSDVGVVPVSARSAAGYRLYDVEAVARLDLVRTLRELGLPLESIRALVHAQSSLAEVAAAHLKALDHQIQTLRLRRAVLRAAAKTNTTAAEVALLHRLATMSEVERQQLIEDFLDDTFGGTDANPELVAMLRAMRPELPEDPEPDQVEAWVELAELVQDPDFRASVRRMADTRQLNATPGTAPVCTLTSAPTFVSGWPLPLPLASTLPAARRQPSSTTSSSVTPRRSRPATHPATAPPYFAGWRSPTIREPSATSTCSTSSTAGPPSLPCPRSSTGSPARCALTPAAQNQASRPGKVCRTPTNLRALGYVRMRRALELTISLHPGSCI